jgi:Cu(I)/Ag(I) efflux system membrane fusion protein
MKRFPLMALCVIAAAVLTGGGFYLGRMTTRLAHADKGVAPSASVTGERRILYWHDPMVPGPRFDKPGKSPFMDMQLAPVYADETSDGGVKVSPTVQQNLGMRVATVSRAEVTASFDAVGAVQFDERLNVAVQTRVHGYVERLAVRAPMERVRKGQVLATVFAPEWLGPLNELVALKRAGVSDDVVAAARDRTRAMSIPPELVRQAEESGTVQGRFTLTSPVSGVVAELGVREGVAVSPGTTLFRIAGLEKVWAVAEVPEAQAVRLVRGQKVKAALQADASRTFDGELKEILPEVSTATRTLKARFEVDNREGKLTPGMLLRLTVAGPKNIRLVVPAEAVIRTGTRAIAIVRKDNGSFEPREISLGMDLGNEVEVTRGLSDGDHVVVSGQFLVDSEARLRSVLGSLTPPTAPLGAASAPAAAASHAHRAEGKVEKVDTDAITISHGPVPSMNWPSMTMGFRKPDAKAFGDIKAGDTVRFEFKEGGPSGYELLSVQRQGAGK